MRPEMELGRIVRAHAGRDKGKYFAVVEIVDDNFVRIADGVSRRLASPKLKKVKHLEAMPQMVDGIADKLRDNQKVFDAELRKAIKNCAE